MARLLVGCLFVLAAPSSLPAGTAPRTEQESRLHITVHGKDGAPVANARVTIEGRTATTASDGLAAFDLPPGTYSLKISSDEFMDYSGTAVVPAQGQASVVVELIPKLTIEEKITVTATRTEGRLEDEPIRIEVVDREDIEEKALMTPGSIAMLLGETTGLRVQTTSPALGAANVRIQGLRGRYSQLLNDGLPLYGLQGDSLSLLQVPPLDLGQVEIIKGAASALYGPSALGGVINLVSQRPVKRTRQVLFNVSSQAAADANFWLVEPPHGSWAATLLGGVNGQRHQDLDHDGWADLPGFTRGAFRPRIFWDNGQGRSGFFTVGVMAETRSGGTLPGAVAPDGRPFPQELDSKRMDFGTVLRFPLSSNRLLTIRGSVAYRGEDRLFGAERERGHQTTWLGEAVLLGTNGRHTWLVGAAAQQDRYRLQPFARFNYRFTTPGLLAQDEIKLGDRSTVGISARLDRHGRYGTFASPRLSFLHKPAAGWTLRFSAGTGFFAPTPFTEETQETGLAHVFVPKPLIAERARSASADASWSQGHWELVGTLFGSLVRHPLERRLSTLGTALINAAEPTRTWGTELLVRYRRDKFLLMGTHAFVRSTESDPESGGRREVPLTPRQVASLNAIWEDERWGHVGIELYYVGRQPLEDNPYRLEGRGYALYGALYQRQLGRFLLFVNLENLGNIRQTRYEPLLRPARALDGRWTVDAWAPLDGRVVNGGLRLNF